MREKELKKSCCITKNGLLIIDFYLPFAITVTLKLTTKYL